MELFRVRISNATNMSVSGWKTVCCEDSCNNESTSDVNNSEQSAICNTKDEQLSIGFIVIPFHFRGCTFYVSTPPAIFFYTFNHFVANQQRNAELNKSYW